MFGYFAREKAIVFHPVASRVAPLHPGSVPTAAVLHSAIRLVVFVGAAGALQRRLEYVGRAEDRHYRGRLAPLLKLLPNDLSKHFLHQVNDALALQELVRNAHAQLSRGAAGC